MGSGSSLYLFIPRGRHLGFYPKPVLSRLYEFSNSALYSAGQLSLSPPRQRGQSPLFNIDTSVSTQCQSHSREMTLGDLITKYICSLPLSLGDHQVRVLRHRAAWWVSESLCPGDRKVEGIWLSFCGTRTWQQRRQIWSSYALFQEQNAMKETKTQESRPETGA